MIFLLDEWVHPNIHTAFVPLRMEIKCSKVLTRAIIIFIRTYKKFSYMHYIYIYIYIK